MTETTNVNAVREKVGFARQMQRFGFGASDMACNFIWQVLTIYIMIYYTDIAHIPVFYVSFLFLFARVIDGFTDVLMGMIIDKTRTRWGKSRPWFLFAAIPFGLLSILCFAVPTSWDVAGRVVYAYITYIGISIAYTMVNAPISSALPSLTADKNERNVLVSYRMVMSSIGSLLITALVSPLVSLIGGGDEAAGVMWTMTIFSVVGVLLFFFAFATIEEVVPPINEEAPTYRESFGTIAKNNHLWIFLLNMCLMWGSYFLYSGVMLYFFAYVVHSPFLMVAAPFVLTLTQILSSSAAPALTKPFPKKKHSFILASILTVAGLAIICIVALGMASPEVIAEGGGTVFDANGKDIGTIDLVKETSIGLTSIWLIFIGIVVMGIGHGWRVTVYYGMMPDAMDYGEWQSGINTSGISSSLTGFFCKLVMAFAGALPTFLFGFTNYASDVRFTSTTDLGVAGESVDSSQILQTVGTKWVLILCFIIIPIIVTALSILIVQFFWTIDDEIDAVREDLNNGLTRDNGQAQAFLTTIRESRKSSIQKAEKDLDALAQTAIDIVGAQNIKKVSSCATKVRLTLNSGMEITEEMKSKAKAAGYFGIVVLDDREDYVQFIAGRDSKQIATNLKSILNH